MERYVPIFQQYAPAPPKIYDLEEMCERSGVLEVCLVLNEKPRLRITFWDHLAFRKAGESDALATLRQIKNPTHVGRSFYVVEDSDYVQWFITQGYGIQRAESLNHITIVTIDDVIDVISLSFPSVTIP